MMSLKNNLAKVLRNRVTQIYSRKRNILHLIQISPEVWVD